MINNPAPTNSTSESDTSATTSALRQIVRHMSENVTVMGMFYDADFVCVNNRFQTITAEETRLWDVQTWELKER